MSFPARHPEDPPFPEDPTAATRHLCAGAYLDDTFRETSLREVYHQTRRLVAPSYGFDLVPVLGHCLKARNAAIARDAALVLTLLMTACISLVAFFGVLIILVGLQVAVETVRLARDAFQRLRGDDPAHLAALGPRAALVGVGWMVVLLVGSLMSGFFLTQLTGSLLGGGLDEAVSTTAATAFGSLVLAALVFASPVTFSLWRQGQLAQLAPGRRVQLPVRNPRLDEIARQQRGNTVVYGGFRPFVGAGELIDTWGFAQRLIRPAQSPNGLGTVPTEREREFDVPPFAATEVLDYVRRDMTTLLPDRLAEEQIAGLTVEDRVHLAGTEVSELSPHVEQQLMDAVIRHPTTPARHYLVCQVFAWGGELITTVYVHIAVQGRSLYLELSTTVLPPCASEFRLVDVADGAPWWGAFKTGLVDTPRAAWRSPLALVRALINLALSSDAPAGGMRLTRGYDYGARVGVRELGSQGSMRNLVQIQDTEKYQRLIERRVIASVLDFLDSRGIDTTEYRNRAASVLSIGTVNVRGDFANVGGRSNFNGPVDTRSGA